MLQGPQPMPKKDGGSKEARSQASEEPAQSVEHEFENIVDVFQIQHHVNDVMCGTD